MIFKKIKEFLKQAKCNHVTSENYAGGGCCGPNFLDNYTTYICMLCGKQITFMGKSPNTTGCATNTTLIK